MSFLQLPGGTPFSFFTVPLLVLFLVLHVVVLLVGVSLLQHRDAGVQVVCRAVIAAILTAFGTLLIVLSVFPLFLSLLTGQLLPPEGTLALILLLLAGAVTFSLPAVSAALLHAVRLVALPSAAVSAMFVCIGVVLLIMGLLSLLTGILSALLQESAMLSRHFWALPLATSLTGLLLLLSFAHGLDAEPMSILRRFRRHLW